MERNDIQGVDRAPKAIETYLLRKGGKNPFGEPNFRLVWSTHRVTQRAGKWNDWDKNIASHERGGIVRLHSGLLVPNGHRPIRTVVEMRFVKKYGFTAGWVLERWIPAAFYGARLEWEARVVEGSTLPKGGPYPVFGDYEMCHNTASVEIPSISELQRVIDRCESAREHHREQTGQVLLEQQNRWDAEEAEERRKDIAATEAFVRDIMRTNYSTSLQMGAHRTRIAESMGIREHVGN